MKKSYFGHFCCFKLQMLSNILTWCTSGGFKSSPFFLHVKYADIYGRQRKNEKKKVLNWAMKNGHKSVCSVCVSLAEVVGWTEDWITFIEFGRLDHLFFKNSVKYVLWDIKNLLKLCYSDVLSTAILEGNKIYIWDHI